LSVELDNETIRKIANVKLDDDLELLKEESRKNGVPIIQDEGLAFLTLLCNFKKPKKILEIGCAVGFSSSYLQRLNKCKVYTVERDPFMQLKAKETFMNLHTDNDITLIKKDALEITDELDGLLFDMIFIDAAKGQNIKFFNKFKEYLAPNGIIVTDNMLFHGFLTEEIHNRNLRQLVRKIKEYHEFLLTNEEFYSQIFNLGDGMAVSMRKNEIIR
jgi:predicted O-methyltransferase YrrM